VSARGPWHRRLRRWAVLGAALWAAGLFALSSMPLGDGSLDFWWRFEHDDKVAHAALYAVLGALVRVASGRGSVAVAGGGLIGIVDEWVVQARVPGRHPDPFDLLADVVGAALGAWAVGAFARRRGRTLE
jgi:Na+/H+-translocating membrane pyrophosphatase